MKLSEAIRIGAAMAPQHFGNFINKDGATCALGAALQAIGRSGHVYSELWHPNGSFTKTLNETDKALCPVCHKKRLEDNNWHSVISHLNDTHRWSREAIADWVESIENKMDAVQPVACGAPSEPIMTEAELVKQTV